LLSALIVELLTNILSKYIIYKSYIHREENEILGLVPEDQEQNRDQKPER